MNYWVARADVADAERCEVYVAANIIAFMKYEAQFPCAAVDSRTK